MGLLKNIYIFKFFIIFLNSQLDGTFKKEFPTIPEWVKRHELVCVRIQVASWME